MLTASVHLVSASKGIQNDVFFMVSDKVKNTANVGLVLLMILAAYSHVMVGDPFDRCAPALVFFFMLSGRLVVW